MREYFDGLCGPRALVNAAWLRAVCDRAGIEYPYWREEGSTADNVAQEYYMGYLRDTDKVKDRMTEGFWDASDKEDKP